MRVVIADDNVLLRAGVAAVLRDVGLEVAAQASCAEDLVREVDEHCPDVVIVDIRMPPTHTDEGLRAADAIRRRHPLIGILILSEHLECGVAMRALAGSPERLGYLLKHRIADTDEFVDTVHRVAGGGTALDPEVISRLLAAGGGNGRLAPLTARERETLELIATGLSNHAIADRVTVTERSVERYVSSIFEKLDLPDTGGENRRVLAVLRYLQG